MTWAKADQKAAHWRGGSRSVVGCQTTSTAALPSRPARRSICSRISANRLTAGSNSHASIAASSVRERRRDAGRRSRRS